MRFTMQGERRRGGAGELGGILLLLCLLLPVPAFATELSCEQNDNAEGGCCCFNKAHTYEFEPRRVSRLEVTFDTGRGIGCRSLVNIQLLRRDSWQTLQTISAISSDGRSQTHRLSGTFDLGETIAGVRIDDGGRCYIDYSKIALDEHEGEAEAEDGIKPALVARPGDLLSGDYRLEAYSNRRHRSLWHLEVAGGKITGTSEWDCCPGRRRDPLKGTVQRGRVQVGRNCSGQGLSGRCYQVYEGTVSNRGLASGTWSHNGTFAGKWQLEPIDPIAPQDPVARIVADPAPPYEEVPVTVDFTVEPGPVPGAVWWLDGRRMTNAEIFFWTFGAAGRHEIELRSARGEPLASFDLSLLQPAEPRFGIVPDKEPPYHVPASLTFRQFPRPVKGARWYVDDTYASSAQTLTREFLEQRRYQVSLRSSRGDVLATYEVALEDPGLQLWGRRWRGSRFDGVRNDLRELELERSAAVTRVEGNAESYCVWTVAAGGAFDQRVLCGGSDQPIVGAILVPGRYIVFPDLADDQRGTQVTLHLRSRSR